ncbi:MAG: hypothetical protein GX821_08055 [Clostridiaceae bacterium]|nr:hypothetical protein [Clostridiaceae bacterium]
MARKKVYAAIDVGSTEITLKIAELYKDALPRVLETLQRTLPLGTDTYTSGAISQPVLDACLQVLEGFVRTLEGYRVAECRAVATSAFREAANRDYALDQIERHSQLTLNILDNAEERSFHLLAASSRLPDFTSLISQGTLIVDVGSGSIQVTVYDKGQFIFSQNMLLGSLRIRDLLADLERRTADFAGLMEEYIASDLDNYRLLEPKGILYQNLVILGGELPYLKRLAGLDPEATAVLGTEQMDRLVQLLLSERPSDLASQSGIPVEHATLLLPTALILRKFVLYTGVKHLQLPSADLCDAVLIDFARQHYGFKPPHDTRQDTLNASRYIARRYHVNQHHTAFVEKAALLLFDETVRLHRLDARARLLLQVAVQLHDAGKYINMSKHHIQSRSLILASEIIGLSQRETALVAWTAGFHIGPFAMDLPGFSDLPQADRVVVAKLTAILRIANALDSGHQQKIASLEVGLETGRLVLQVKTRYDILLEIWALERQGRLFWQLFAHQPVIKIRSSRT